MMLALSDGCFMLCRTINKCQGQTLKYIGVALVEPILDAQQTIVRVDAQPCFAHGQLTVALTRVGHPDALRVYMDTTSFASGQTLCPMYPEALIRPSGGRSTAVTFENIFGDGLQEPDNWDAVLNQAENMVRNGRPADAVRCVLPYRPPEWGASSCNRWYQVVTCCGPSSNHVADMTEVCHEDYLVQVAECQQHAIDIFAAGDDDCGQWQLTEDGLGDRDACAGYCGPEMDYHPAPLRLGDEDLALMAANQRAWNMFASADDDQGELSVEELENILSAEELEMWHDSQTLHELGENSELPQELLLDYALEYGG